MSVRTLPTSVRNPVPAHSTPAKSPDSKGSNNALALREERSKPSLKTGDRFELVSLVHPSSDPRNPTLQVSNPLFRK